MDEVNIQNRNILFLKSFILDYLKDFAKLPLYHNAGYLLAINLFPAAMGFIFWTLASRFYTAFNVGLAASIISAVSLLSGVAGLGTNFGLIRFIPAASNPHRMINSVLSLNAVLSVMSSLVFLIGMPVWSAKLQPVLGNYLLSTVFIVFVWASTLGTSVQAVCLAFRRASHAFYFTVISSVARVVLVMLGVQWGVLGLVGTSTLAFCLALGVSTWVLLPRVSAGFRWAFQMDWSDMKTLLPFSGSNYVSIFVMQTAQTILPLITLQVLGVAASAYSYIALMVGTLAVSPGTALAISAFAEGANSIEDFHQTFRKALISSMLITIAVSVVLLVGAGLLLTWFGKDYATEGAGLLRWMALAGPPSVLTQLVFTYLRLKKRNGLLVLLSLALMIVSVLVAYFLMPLAGISANGIGILAANSLVVVISAVFWRKMNSPIQPGKGV